TVKHSDVDYQTLKKNLASYQVELSAQPINKILIQLQQRKQEWLLLERQEAEQEQKINQLQLEIKNELFENQSHETQLKKAQIKYENQNNTVDRIKADRKTLFSDKDPTEEEKQIQCKIRI